LLQRESPSVAPGEGRPVRALDIALAALTLRALPTQSPKAQRLVVPLVGDADAIVLDRAAIPHQHAALIASLWPAPTRQCVASPRYQELPAPALFGVVYRVSWPPPPIEDARALQARLRAAFRERKPTEGDIP
jgi:hypothetical protein